MVFDRFDGRDDRFDEFGESGEPDEGPRQEETLPFGVEAPDPRGPEAAPEGGGAVGEEAPANSAPAVGSDSISIRRQSTGEWERRALWTAAGLELVAASLLVGTAAQGVVAPGSAGPVGARMGAAFVGQAGTSPGLALLAAAALACWASISGDRALGPGPRRTLVGCLVLAALLCVATPLAMAGDVAYLHHARQPVNGALRWGLGTFGLVTFIPGLLAAAVAWWGFQDLS